MKKGKEESKCRIKSYYSLTLQLGKGVLRNLAGLDLGKTASLCSHSARAIVLALSKLELALHTLSLSVGTGSDGSGIAFVHWATGTSAGALGLHVGLTQHFLHVAHVSGLGGEEQHGEQADLFQHFFSVISDMFIANR